MDVTIEGVPELRIQLDNMSFHIKGNVIRRINQEADIIFNQSQELVPYLTGELKASGNVNHANMSKTYITINYNSEYAMRQHEDMTYKHSNGRQAKYLERPFKARESILRNAIIDEINKGMK